MINHCWVIFKFSNYQIFKLIYFNEGEIVTDGPEYKLKSSDKKISAVIIDRGGRVVIESTPEDRIAQIAIHIATSQLVRFIGFKNMSNAIKSGLIGTFLANPVMIAINDLCYHFQQLISPGMDLNFVVSLDLGYGFQDFSFNILFVILIAIFMKKAVEMNEFKI